MDQMTAKKTRGRGIMLKNLKVTRERKGLSLQDLQDKSGVYRSTISELENLHRGAQGRIVHKFANALEVSTDELVG